MTIGIIVKSGKYLPKPCNIVVVKYKLNLLPAATIETTMEVVVDELWTRTVAKMPIIRPATGLLRISFEAKASPAAFPPNRRKALLRKSNEQMNKYRRPRSRTILVKAKATRRNFPLQSSSVGQQRERFDHIIISPIADPKIFLMWGYNFTLLHRHWQENIILVCIMYQLLFSVCNTSC